MSLSKQTVTDKIESVKVNDYYTLQVREVVQIKESGSEISSSYHRYVLQPDADVSAISDPVVLAQFNAVMTDEVKANYQTFLEAQINENNSD